MARIPSINERVTALEQSMNDVKTDLHNVKSAVDIATENSEEILRFLTATKGVSAFAKKHGPRLLAFGVGVAISGGYINPEFGALIRGFFGA